MIGSDSPLRLLPTSLDRKQALFLDGIRHAVEIANLSYIRLTKTLAGIARVEDLDSEGTAVAAFADAWTFIDAVHRFSSLQKLSPGFSEMCGPRLPGDLDFQGLIDNVRLLRNVADHVAGKVDQLVAKRMPILGLISWFTLDPDMEGGKSCVVAPGSLAKTTAPVVNPLGKQVCLHSLTGLIYLSAGVHRVNLSDVHEKLSTEVRRLEEAIGAQTAGMEHSPSDALVILAVKFAEGSAPVIA